MARNITDKSLISALVSKGFTAAEALAIAGGEAPVTPEPKAPKANTFFENVIRARVSCAHNAASCKGISFAPNGVGSRQHTTCPKGRAALKAARS